MLTRSGNLLNLSSLGPVEEGTAEKVEIQVTDQEKARLKRVEARPPLSEILNLHDFEVRYFLSIPYLSPSELLFKAIARLTMPEKAWAYYSSASDDEITNRENHAAFHRFVSSCRPGSGESRMLMLWLFRIWFRPRILRDVTNVDWSTTILGHPSKMPVYIVSGFGFPH